MQKNDAARLLRPLRGTHVFIMLAYLMIQEPLTVAELCNCTGLSDDVLRPALKYLEGEGYLCKQVGKNGRVNWLPVGSSFLGQLFQSPRLSDSGPMYVVNVESEESQENKSTPTFINGQSPRLSDSGVKKDDSANQINYTFDQRELIAALKECGIKGKKLQTLLTLPWLSVEYIRAHWAKIQTEQWDSPVGMLVYRIEGEEPAPELQEVDKKFHVRVVDRGKRGIEEYSFGWDVDAEIAEYMGHEKGCNCVECRWIISHMGQLDSVCPGCKHHDCECEE